MPIIITIISLIFTFLSKFSKPKKSRIAPTEFDHNLRVENYPSPFPNGWFNLCSSSAVAKGKVIEVEAFDQKFAVFRGENGIVKVFDVFCPHLNANLADGFVKGNNLVCPFHGWEFKQDGQCGHIPYSKDAPPKVAKVKTWEVLEVWGLILVWFHAEDKAPSWNPEHYLPELANYNSHGNTSDILNIHLQDFAENGADYGHFNFVHGLMTVPFSENTIKVEHTVNINFGEGDEKHLAWFTDVAQLCWKKSGKPIKDAGGEALVRYFGPGFLIFKLNSKLAKDITIVKTFTPIGPLKLRMDDYIFSPKGTNPFARRYIVSEAAAQFHDDILIWERKGFAKKPLLIKEDGPIIEMRNWYSQFYSDANSGFKSEEKVVEKEDVLVS